MPKLSDTQRVILSAACQRDDRTVLPLPKSMGGEKPNLAAGNSIKSMLKNGLIEEVGAKLGEPMWRETGDGHGVTLVATDAALAALGIAPARNPAEAGRLAAAVDGGGLTGGTPADQGIVAGMVDDAKRAKNNRGARKKAAKKQGKPTHKKAEAPSKPPRADSKQAQLIAMLKRAKGASIDEIVEAMSWQPHYADVRIMPTCIGNPACGAVIAAMCAA